MILYSYVLALVLLIPGQSMLPMVRMKTTNFMHDLHLPAAVFLGSWAFEFHTNMLCCCFAGKETVDDLFYYSMEYEPNCFVTVDDLFHFHISNLVAPLNFTSVFNL